MRYLMGMLLVVGSLSTSRAERKDWGNNLELEVTRCFRTKDISVSCEDGFVDDNLKARLKDINLIATDRDGHVYSYTYGRALPPSMCNLHSARINDLKKGTTQACITGDAESETKKNETTANWLAFETQKGEVHRNRSN